ncbi:hypothetical protein F5884DRAFT_744698 [Xylogone sp. PMI_703]|nr:hypothetical protein F5884DRAFT_744698 [Xylogone sp. PMI_703]
MEGFSEETVEGNHTPSYVKDKHRRKRKHEDDASSLGMGQSLSSQDESNLPESSLTSTSRDSRDTRESAEIDTQGWQTVENGRPAKKAKKIPKKESGNYPAIEFAKSSRLQSQIKISDLQNLVLYILTDSQAPQFVSVRNRHAIRRVVVLMVPGLERSMFLEKVAIEKDGDEEQNEEKDGRDKPSLQQHIPNWNSPDHYFPRKLEEMGLQESLQPFTEMFELLWPVTTPGDTKYSQMHSPLHAMLTAPLSKGKQEKKNKGAQPAREPLGWQNKRTAITEFIHPPDELLENEYVLHPASYDTESERDALKLARQAAKHSAEDGWVDTLVEHFEDGIVPDKEIEKGSLTAGREVLAMDCEMCKTDDNEFSLTRISLVGWDGSVVLDELVKPEKPIIDYLTMYSGITEAMLANVTTTLQDIQKKLLKILHPRTILLGHSLNSDLTALKLTHPYVIDTALLYPHPRGPPLKSSLKWLAQKYLSREIQKGHGTTGPGAGHDSIEDAKTCLDLLKQKCEKGKMWGTSDAAGENIFKRIARTGVKFKSQGGTGIPGSMGGRTSAAIDWGDPKKGAGAAATHIIGCKNDEEVTQGVVRAVLGDPDGKEIPGGGVDFVWARMRELEALKGWWNTNVPGLGSVELKDDSKTDDPLPAVDNLPIDFSTPIEKATADLTRRLSKIYEALPPCTALIVYSGSGDPREMSRLQAMHRQYRKEFSFKKWDQLSVKWTDVEEQALKAATKIARDGIGFVGIK